MCFYFLFLFLFLNLARTFVFIFCFFRSSLYTFCLTARIHDQNAILLEIRCVFVFFFRSVSCEVSSDLIVQVKGNRYLLHKVNFMLILIAFEN